jgi:hypothetical protein
MAARLHERGYPNPRILRQRVAAAGAERVVATVTNARCPQRATLAWTLDNR